MANFYIRDADLNTVSKGLTKYTCDANGENVADNTAFTLVYTTSEPVANCTATEHKDDAAETVVQNSNTEAGFNTDGSTPLVSGSLVLKEDSVVLGYDGLNEAAGTFALNNAQINLKNAAPHIAKAYYSYNTKQTYSNAVGTSDLNGLRAHVVSTSDSTGEWIEIKETTGEGAAPAAAAPNSSGFVGQVAFSTDAAAAAAGTVSN